MSFLLQNLRQLMTCCLVGTSTASARFAVKGIASGTPIATLSASTNNAGIYLDAANSALQGVKQQHLNHRRQIPPAMSLLLAEAETVTEFTSKAITVTTGNGFAKWWSIDYRCKRYASVFS